MNKLLTLTIACVCVASCPGLAHAVFTTAPGYESNELYSSDGSFTTIGGLDLDNGKLYFGNYTDIISLDLSDSSNTTVGTIDRNAGNALVVRHNGVTWTAYGSESFSPYPHKMGYFDAGGNYINRLDEDGIYDVAVNSSGDCYIAANPDEQGSKIYNFNWDTFGITEIADIGGYSGGLAFDSADNLYYAEQTNGKILKFTSSEVATGGLTASDADVVLDITAGYIGFNDSDEFFATTGFGSTFSQYDLSTQSLVEDIAYGGVGKFVVDGNDIYLVDTDWGAYASTVQAVSAVPEPSTLVLLLGMALAAVAIRR